MLTGTNRRIVCRTEEINPSALLSIGKATAGLSVLTLLPEESNANAQRYRKRELRRREERTRAVLA